MSVTSSSPLEVAKAASIASRSLAVLPVQARNDALFATHQALVAAKDKIMAANAKDVELATKAAADGKLSQSILKRLDLARKGKWEDMLQGILDVRELEDPGKKLLLALWCLLQLIHRTFGSHRRFAPQSGVNLRFMLYGLR